MTRARRCRPAGAGARLMCALLVVLPAGCATTGPQPPAPDCTVTESAPAASIRVSVPDSIDPAHAPVPANRHERFLFAQIYETLIRLGCDGTVVPALATSWSSGADGLTWRFELRRDVMFTDGAPLDARTLATSWSAARHVPPLAGVEAIGEYTLQVRLYDAADAGFFAQPALAVTRDAAGTEWPHGTGAYRVDASAPTLRLVRRRPSTGAPDTLHVERLAAGDERSALDDGVDFLVTGSPATIAYARLLDGYTTTALPWDRTYALITGADGTAQPPSMEDRTALARDAAPVGTRSAREASIAECAAPSAAAPSAPASASHSVRRILYPRGDVVARGLAERIVALAWPASRTPDWLRARLGASMPTAPLRAVAVDRPALAREMQAARDAIFIVALHECHPTDAIRTALARSMLHATPLVDAHDHVIFRDGVGTLMVDGSATLHLGERP